jgi:hypothetical protein
VPAVLWLGLVDASFTECTCTHGVDANCPVHHRTMAGSRGCAMQSLTTSAAATLNVLFGVVGLVPAPSVPTGPVRSPGRAALECSMATQRPFPPDPPPPRA